MAARRLVTALTVFSRCLKDARDLVDDARKWSIPTQPGARAQISPQRRTLIEIAFLHLIFDGDEREVGLWGCVLFLDRNLLKVLLHELGHMNPDRILL